VSSPAGSWTRIEQSRSPIAQFRRSNGELAAKTGDFCSSCAYSVSWTWKSKIQVLGFVDVAPGRISYWTPGRKNNDGVS
jgi:hypothetical protein